MNKEATLRCESCQTRECAGGKDCLGLADRYRALYEVEGIARLHRAASAIEGRHYCKENRLREIMLFAHELGCRKLGLAFCIGLAQEGQTIAEILAREFEVVAVCCKFCGIDKKLLKLEQIIDDRRESMCNPAGQAAFLNESHTELNITVGLCVGHDAIFSIISQAPVTTLIVKDRVLAHNPIGAVYCRYIRRTMLPEKDSPRS
jgi:uncharacterized metal-binding protein